MYVSSTSVFAKYNLNDRLKEDRMGWAFSTYGEKMNAYSILVEKPELNKPLGRPRRRWEDNNKTDLRQIGWGDMDWIHLAQDRDH
jgi:hypothetical protein